MYSTEHKSLCPLDRYPLPHSLTGAAWPRVSGGTTDHTRGGGSFGSVVIIIGIILFSLMHVYRSILLWFILSSVSDQTWGLD